MWQRLRLGNRVSQQPLHIHFYAGPGAGKSTLAPAVYTLLKIKGVRAELVTEVAKELLWEGRLTPERQMLTTSEQMNREERLRPHADVIVTESPALLGVVYSLPTQREALRQCVLSVTQDWNTMSYLIDRDVKKNYEQFGRRENPEESLEKTREIRALLNSCKIPYEVLNMNQGPEAIMGVAAKIRDEILNYGGPQLQRHSLKPEASMSRVMQALS